MGRMNSAASISDELWLPHRITKPFLPLTVEKSASPGVRRRVFHVSQHAHLDTTGLNDEFCSHEDGWRTRSLLTHLQRFGFGVI